MKKSTIRIVLKIIEWEIFLVFIVLIFVLVLPMLPINSGFLSYIIVSGSMEPTIHKGSISIVQKDNPSNLEPGTIVAFKSPINSKDTIVHRLIGVKDNKFITKGDNNNTKDSWNLASSDIKGEVLFTFPYLGYISLYVKSVKGFTLLVGVPALILIVLQIKKIKEGIEEEIEKRSLQLAAKYSRESINSLI